MSENMDLYRIRKIAGQLSGLMRKHRLEDVDELKEWMENNTGASEVMELLSDTVALGKAIALYRSGNVDQAVEGLHRRIVAHKRKRLSLAWGGVAALFVLGCFSLLFITRSGDETLPMAGMQKVPEEVPVIIRPDGSRIDLANTSMENLAEHRLRIDSKQGNRLEYSLQAADTVSPGQDALGYNTLVIPSGADYQIRLSDGSVIRLNAESRLEYADVFPSSERRVRLKGEGYFKVSPETRPFIVEANGVAVRVYGTEFNVNAYEEKEVETVLVRGKVGVAPLCALEKEKILRPNQLSRIDPVSGTHTVSTVDVQRYTAWLSGLFRYDDGCLEDMVRDLERWYGVAFDYASPDLRSLRFSASIQKDLPLEEVLAMIEKTVKVKFNLMERRYFISR